MKVWVGGNLPESVLSKLVETLQDDQVQLIDGWDPIQDSIENLLREFKEPNPIEFVFEAELDRSTGTPTGTLNLDDFCQEHDLTYRKLLSPGTSGEEHYNECYLYWQPGMEDAVYIPTNGEGEITVVQSEVLELHEQCWELSQRPLTDMPLLINDGNAIAKFYAKASMAGKSFNKIFKELLISHLGHEEVGCPPFKIVHGR